MLRIKCCDLSVSEIRHTLPLSIYIQPDRPTVAAGNKWSDKWRRQGRGKGSCIFMVKNGLKIVTCCVIVHPGRCSATGVDVPAQSLDSLYLLLTPGALLN